VSESVTEQGKLKQKPYAVFGIGSNSYPRFCAAADLVDSMLVGAGGQRLAPVQKGAFCSVLCCAVLCCAVLCCAVLPGSNCLLFAQHCMPRVWLRVLSAAM